MSNDTSEVASLNRTGLEALRRGDAVIAAEHFRRATAMESAGADSWFGLSLAYRALGSPEAEAAALDRALQLESRHLPALLRKGDLYTAQSNPRAAASFYRATLKIARSAGALSAQWRSEIARIEELIRETALDFERHLTADLRRHGLGEPGIWRFAHALDLLLGRRQIYHQQPQIFYFPELPPIQFYDRADFSWARALEEDATGIRAELCGILQANRFSPYMQPDPDCPAFNTNSLLNDPSWSACHLIKGGEEVAANAALCPVTMNALRRLPLCCIEGRTPTALFSLLGPGTHIPPHHGFLNTRLICHLPLIVPPGCALRVGNETRHWREGEAVIFDDTIEHEAWKRSQEPRVVLLFDIWRPELTARERSLVAAMLESIDRYGGPRREWTQ